MVAQLVRHERLETTLPKAKELRRVADRAVTWGKTGDIPARRAAAAFLPRAGNDGTLAKLFGPLAARYADREGGYTRVLASRVRGGDGARMAWIEFVDRPGEMRRARPPKGRRAGGLLPASAGEAGQE